LCEQPRKLGQDGETLLVVWFKLCNAAIYNVPRICFQMQPCALHLSW